MKEIKREIASAIIFSKDGKMLLGFKDPESKGSYPGMWHIPGGGLKDGETILDALYREVHEETGLNVQDLKLKPLPLGGHSSEKLDKESGEMVMAHMRFNRFEIHLDQNADEITLDPDGEFTKLRWFTPKELQEIEQIPGGEEFFIEMGYMGKPGESPSEFKVR